MQTYLRLIFTLLKLNLAQIQAILHSQIEYQNMYGCKIANTMKIKLLQSYKLKYPNTPYQIIYCSRGENKLGFIDLYIICQLFSPVEMKLNYLRIYAFEFLSIEVVLHILASYRSTR